MTGHTVKNYVLLVDKSKRMTTNFRKKNTDAFTPVSLVPPCLFMAFKTVSKITNLSNQGDLKLVFTSGLSKNQF